MPECFRRCGCHYFLFTCEKTEVHGDLRSSARKAQLDENPGMLWHPGVLWHFLLQRGKHPDLGWSTLAALSSEAGSKEETASWFLGVRDRTKPDAWCELMFEEVEDREAHLESCLNKRNHCFLMLQICDHMLESERHERAWGPSSGLPCRPPKFQGVMSQLASLMIPGYGYAKLKSLCSGPNSCVET